MCYQTECSVLRSSGAIYAALKAGDGQALNRYLPADDTFEARVPVAREYKGPRAIERSWERPYQGSGVSQLELELVGMLITGRFAYTWGVESNGWHRYVVSNIFRKRECDALWLLVRHELTDCSPNAKS